MTATLVRYELLVEGYSVYAMPMENGGRLRCMPNGDIRACHFIELLYSEMYIDARPESRGCDELCMKSCLMGSCFSIPYTSGADMSIRAVCKATEKLIGKVQCVEVTLEYEGTPHLFLWEPCEGRVTYVYYETTSGKIADRFERLANVESAFVSSDTTCAVVSQLVDPEADILPTLMRMCEELHWML